jgi:hypothetical protein
MSLRAAATEFGIFLSDTDFEKSVSLKKIPNSVRVTFGCAPQNSKFQN